MYGTYSTDSHSMVVDLVRSTFSFLVGDLIERARLQAGQPVSV